MHVCYDDKDRPPIPPGAPGEVQNKDVVLTAADGNRFAAFVAEPSQPEYGVPSGAGEAQEPGAQIVIYPDVRGLHGFYKDLARRFAQVGVRALALDYFGRTAGVTARGDAFDHMPHVQQVQVPNVVADMRAALAYLREGAETDHSTFVVGFCMGGSLALLSATQDLDLAGVIAFYAGMSRDFGGYGTALDHASSVKFPVLGLFGGDDPGIPAEKVAQLDARLDEAGVGHELVSYPGAPHSFFDRKATDYADASADAWRRMLAFIEAHR